MRLALLVVLAVVLACRSDAAGEPTAGSAGRPVHDDARAGGATAAAPDRDDAAAATSPAWSKKVLTKAERAAAVKAIAKAFPKDWRPQVTVDEAGFPEEVDLRMPTPIADAAAVDRVLEIIRPRAALFGIRDAAAVRGVLRYGEVWVFEGERWTGQLHVRFDGRTVTMIGHLWPFETPAVSAAGIEPVLKPFIGLEGSEPSKCTCPHDRISVTLVRESFEVTPGIALVCREHVLTTVPAIALRARVATYADIAGLDKLPRLVDARTLEPIAGDFWMPPRGSLAEAGPTFDGHDVKWAAGHCIVGEP